MSQIDNFYADFKPLLYNIWNTPKQDNDRTQRVLGRLISEGQTNGEIAKRGDFGTLKQNESVSHKEVLTEKKTFADLGITKQQSSVFQQIAKIRQSFEGITKELIRE